MGKNLSDEDADLLFREVCVCERERARERERERERESCFAR